MKGLLRKLTFIFVVVLTLVVFVGCGEPINKPENIQYDGVNITWNAVQNATGYVLNINDGSDLEVSNAKYPYNANNQSFTVTIVAVTDERGFSDSEETTVSFSPLGTINKVNVAPDGTLSWDPINLATGYIIRVDGIDLPEVVHGTSYNGIQGGTHTIQVRAVIETDTSYYSVFSSPLTLNFLGSVNKEDIKYSKGIISWPGVAGAQYYEISINGMIVDSKLTYNNYEYDAKRENFTVTIRAIGDHVNTYDGVVSETKSFVFLDTVTNVKVSDGIISWDPINNASGYQLKINGIEQPQILTEPWYDKLSANQNYRIQILPISNDSTFFSDWSVDYSVTILPIPVVRWNDEYNVEENVIESINWDSVPNAAGYEVVVTYPNGETRTFSYGGSQVYFDQENFLEVGEYSIKVKALANNTNTNVYDSLYSKPINVTRLQAPTFVEKNHIVSDPSDVTEGFVVTFNKVTKATSYKLYKDGSEVQVSASNQFKVADLVNSNNIEEQNYNFEIQACGEVYKLNGTTEVVLNSLRSSEVGLNFKITVLATPAPASISGYTYSFGKVNNSQGYVIDFNGQEIFFDNNEYDLKFLEAGDFYIRVCAQGNGTTILPSTYSARLNIHRLEAPENVKITTADNAEGQIDFTEVQYATGYNLVLNSDGQALSVQKMDNVNSYIKESATSVYMEAIANYMDESGNVYYMSSQPSRTYSFIKLAAPTFGDVAFNDTQLYWNHPINVNTEVYTPTYEVYDSDGAKFTGEKNGTNMDISYLEGGVKYSFSVKAIGDGVQFINSEKSAEVTVYKLATPELICEKGMYKWKPVINAVNYAVYVDGELVQKVSEKYDGEYYSYMPKFNDLKTYKVEVIAVGDGGYTSINSNTELILQETKQLEKPEYTVSYSHDTYNVDGKIKIEITNESQYAIGYTCTIGGITGTTEGTTYEYNPNSTGEFDTSVYATGGGFDENGVYYIDSQSVGGSSYKIILLPSPNASSITISKQGSIEWPTAQNANGYTLLLKVGNEDFKEIQVREPMYVLENYMSLESGTQITIKVCSNGNGSNIVSSQYTEFVYTKK